MIEANAHKNKNNNKTWKQGQADLMSVHDSCMDNGLHFCLSSFGWGRIRGMEWKAHFSSKLRFYLSRLSNVTLHTHFTTADIT